MKAGKLIKFTLGAVLTLGLFSQAYADDKAADPSGTYIWTMAGRNGGPTRTNTLVLKVDGDKVTGKISSPGRGGQSMDTDITDGQITNSTVSFSVVREYQGNSFTNKYSGTVADGAITGKMEMMRNGEPQSRDWKATIQK